MPNYYNPYMYSPNMYASYGYQPTAPMPPVSQTTAGNNYMVSVDGEMAARAWQSPTQMGPNMIIPLWDLDGQHVYFKSTDAYGRMNPLRKGRVVFDDDVTNLPEGVSGAPDMSGFVTKDDLNDLRHELRNLIRDSNQNGRKVSGDQHLTNRGDSR